MDYGININGDRPLRMLKKGATAAENAGFSYLWVGEKPQFMHPFPVVAALAQSTKKVTIGSGIISPFLNRCRHITGGFRVMREVYGDRFIVGLAPGDKWGLRDLGVEIHGVKKRIEECLSELKKKGFKVYVGASEPTLASKGSVIADGLLINYVKPEYVKWAIAKAVKSVKKAAYGPSLLLPDEDHRELLLVGAAIVASGSNAAFQREFGLEEWVTEIRDIIRRRSYGELRGHEDRLLDEFTLCGRIEDMGDRLKELKKVGVSQVIFGGPLSHNISSVLELGKGLQQL
jgi:5,10-methylenetetrahydromethanopterin reductase